MQKKHPKINFRIHNSNGKKKRIFEIIGAPLKCEAGSGCESQKSKKMSCFDFAWGHFWTCSHWTPLFVLRWYQVKSFPFAILLLFVLLSVLLRCCPGKFRSQDPSPRASFWKAFEKEVWKAKARSQDPSPKAPFFESFLKGCLKRRSKLPGSKSNFEGGLGQQKPNLRIQAQKLQFSKVLRKEGLESNSQITVSKPTSFIF